MRTVLKFGGGVLDVIGKVLSNESGELIVDQNGNYLTFV